mmetsp:Transcript_30967/g.72411  ORF Transcript_30967/g.72411 Transcript_30967/m.72411 type:complete len:105 (-) Transcript_30967:52-366(-)
MDGDESSGLGELAGIGELGLVVEISALGIVTVGGGALGTVTLSPVADRRRFSLWKSDGLAGEPGVFVEEERGSERQGEGSQASVGTVCPSISLFSRATLKAAQA